MGNVWGILGFDGNAENAGRPVSRVLYPPVADGGHLSSPDAVYPHRPVVSGQRCRWGRAANPGTSRTPMVPLFGLAPGGVWPPVRRRTRPGALTARFHPCRPVETGRRYVSVPLSVPGSVSRAGAWALPSTPSGGARTFLPKARGLAAATRPVRLSPDARLAWACRGVKQPRAQPVTTIWSVIPPAEPRREKVAFYV